MEIKELERKISAIHELRTIINSTKDLSLLKNIDLSFYNKPEPFARHYIVNTQVVAYFNFIRDAHLNINHFISECSANDFLISFLQKNSLKFLEHIEEELCREIFSERNKSHIFVERLDSIVDILIKKGDIAPAIKEKDSGHA